MRTLVEQGPFMQSGYFHDKTPGNRLMLPGVRPPHLVFEMGVPDTY